MQRIILSVTVLAAVSGCGGEGGSEGVSSAPPAAAQIAPGTEAAQLTDQLDRLVAELNSAVEGESDHLLRAEAITDRLLQAPRRVDWLATGYDVEARLRQMQAMADGLVARMRRGSTLEDVGPEVALLRAAVADLQQQLQLPGGGAPPPTLDSLLAQDPLRDVGAASLQGLAGEPEAEEEPEEAQATTSDGGLLGTPVQDDGP